MKTSFILFVFILTIYGFVGDENNTFLKCNDPFFKSFKIKKLLICNDVIISEFDEVPSLRKISIFKDQIGLLFFRDNKFFFKAIEINSEKSRIYRLELGTKLIDLERNSVSFGFNSKHFFLYLNKKIFCGELTFPIIKLKLIRELANEIRFMKVFEDRVYLVDYGCRSRIKDSLTTDTFIYMLDLKNYSLNTVSLGVPKGYYFTLFYPPEVLDISGKYIASSEITTYDIKIYDKDGNFITQIRKVDSLFNEIDLSLHQKFVSLLREQSVFLKSVIDTMRPIFFGGIGVIEKLNFINDSMLLVRWYGPKSDKSKWYPDIYYDIWIISKDTINLLEKNIKARFPQDTILKICEPLYSSRYECGSNSIVTFFGTFSNKVGELNETIGEYHARQKESYGNTPKLLLTVYSYER